MGLSHPTKSLVLNKQRNPFSFSKYHGTGNDFILIDDRDKTFPIRSIEISKLCHRQYGIGGDGIIFLQSSREGDFSMRIFNRDGSEAEMCGNGLRCLIQFLIDLGERKTEFIIETKNANYRCIYKEGIISIDMGVPKIIEEFSSGLLIEVGVPHLVVFVEDLSHFDKEAKDHFDSLGVNINYAKIDPFGTIHMRTFERGVEEETFSCGTGASAVCMAAWSRWGIEGPVQVVFASGEHLQFKLFTEDRILKNIEMSGSAHHVFSGKI